MDPAVHALFDDGAVTDLINGEKIRRNPDTIIIMTTNLGSRDVSKGVNMGFAGSGDKTTAYDQMKAKVIG